MVNFYFDTTVLGTILVSSPTPAQPSPPTSSCLQAAGIFPEIVKLEQRLLHLQTPNPKVGLETVCVPNKYLLIT